MSPLARSTVEPSGDCGQDPLSERTGDYHAGAFTGGGIPGGHDAGECRGNPYGSSEPTGRLNYWGYTKAGMFAPKASYADPGMSPVTEFKYMVRELHRAGLEGGAGALFSGKEVPEFVLETVRFWVPGISCGWNPF